VTVARKCRLKIRNGFPSEHGSLRMDVSVLRSARVQSV